MKKTISSNKPTSFGKRKGGKAAKSRGPKCKKVSQYRGQGR
ncbi:hypothetical protein [Cylindrospermopsis raciborskii]|nr:hypothetical protein [Cylindrospermopsis raciborskii]MCZ2207992.1 hypothetical protein [Cylindrospermopsis raciborskii PAMP2011]